MYRQMITNEIGEPLGFETIYEPDPFDAYDAPEYWDDYEDEAPYDGNPSACIEAGKHGNDADQKDDGSWECQWCFGDCTDVMDDDDYALDEPLADHEGWE